MSIWFYFNIIFMILTWRWAMKDFENGREKLGWVNIVISAWNGAAAASAVV